MPTGGRIVPPGGASPARPAPAAAPHPSLNEERHGFGRRSHSHRQCFRARRSTCSDRSCRKPAAEATARCSLTRPPSILMPKNPHPLVKGFKLSEIKQLSERSGLSQNKPSNKSHPPASHPLLPQPKAAPTLPITCLSQLYFGEIQAYGGDAYCHQRDIFCKQPWVAREHVSCGTGPAAEGRFSSLGLLQVTGDDVAPVRALINYVCTVPSK